MKSYGDEVMDFYDKGIPKLHSNHTCWVVISQILSLIRHSALKEDENYYLQLFLKECKCIEKEVITYINNEVSDFCYSDESEKE